MALTGLRRVLSSGGSKGIPRPHEMISPASSGSRSGSRTSWKTSRGRRAGGKDAWAASAGAFWCDGAGSLFQALPAENHGFRFVGVHYHPSLSQSAANQTSARWRSRSVWASRNTWHTNNRHAFLRFLNPDPVCITNGIKDEVQRPLKTCYVMWRALTLVTHRPHGSQ